MTFYGSEETAVQAFRLGAKDYLIKPFEKEEACEVIKNVLNEDKITHKTAQIFLCYAREDRERVRPIHDGLEEAGFAPWWDEDLLPGQKWEVEIEKAIERSDIFLACFSDLSVSKAGYYHKEINKALEVMDTKPEDVIFIIPVRLDNCVVPRKLSKFQWVNLHGPLGFPNLVKAIREEIARREKWLKSDTR